MSENKMIKMGPECLVLPLEFYREFYRNVSDSMIRAEIEFQKIQNNRELLELATSEAMERGILDG